MFIIKEDFRTFIKKYPFTVLIVGVCSLLTILISLMGGYTQINVILLGAYDRDLIHNGQFWRLLTCSVGHMSYPHFFLNIVFILLFSWPLERALGKVKFVLCYLFTSIFTTIFIHIFSNIDYVAGSSGFGYGLLGMYFYLFLKFRNQFYKRDRQFIFMFVAIGFTMTLLIPSVSFSGHLGGFIGGIIFAALVFKKEQQVLFST